MITSQIIVAYHGCDITVGDHIVEGTEQHLEPSQNPYDWLGEGIYFFEDDLLRAVHFAQASADNPEKKLTAKSITNPYAIGAVIRLGNCLDLSKQSGIAEFKKAYEELKATGRRLPKNKTTSTNDEEGILHNLDRAVINYIHRQRCEKKEMPYDTVRGFFHQGNPAFATSAIGQLSHVQIAVRNTSCILGYFHPAVTLDDPFQGLTK